MKYLIYSTNELKIVDTWEECSVLTKGVKGKKFKKFRDDEIEDMIKWFVVQIKSNSNNKDNQYIELQKLFNSYNINNYIKENTSDFDSNFTIKKKGELTKEDISLIQIELNKILDNNIVAFVDGSYNKNTKEYSYGMCVVHKDNLLYENKNKYVDTNGMWQINGELKGALLACNFAIKNGIDKIYIGYDYAGIEKFATGEWKSSKDSIIYYKEQMMKYMKAIDIEFIKLPSHCNIAWNEYADRLSKQALGI